MKLKLKLKLNGLSTFLYMVFKFPPCRPMMFLKVSTSKSARYLFFLILFLFDCSQSLDKLQS